MGYKGRSNFVGRYLFDIVNTSEEAERRGASLSVVAMMEDFVRKLRDLPPFRVVQNLCYFGHGRERRMPFNKHTPEEIKLLAADLPLKWAEQRRALGFG